MSRIRMAGDARHGVCDWLAHATQTVNLSFLDAKFPEVRGITDLSFLP